MKGRKNISKILLGDNFSSLDKNFFKFTKFYNHLNSKFRDTNLSLIKGSTSIKLKEITIGQQLDLISKRFPNNDAIYVHHQKTKLTFEELNLKVSQTAKAFISLGLTKNSKVAIYAPNCIEWVLSQYGSARIGVQLANINPAYQINDLKYSLKMLGVNTLIMTRKLKSTDYLEIINKLNPDLKDSTQNMLNLSLKELPDLKQIILLDDLAAGEFQENHVNTIRSIAKENNMIFWNDLIDSIGEITTNYKIEALYSEFKNSVNPHDPTNIQFTSGTTGLPKGALLSHYNIINNGYLISRHMNYTEKDRVLIPVPLYHCFGSVMGNLACLNSGSAIIYPNATFDAEKSLEVLEQEKCTSLYGVPTMFIEVLNNQKKLQKHLPNLSKGIMAGAVCPKYLMDRCFDELNLKNLMIGYGMTELSPITHLTSPHDSIEKKTTTVGQILPHTETKIVDEEGNILLRNMKGEICSKGYGLFIGYYGNEKATKESIDQEGFMKTGDIGYVDDEGYLYIEGRKKDTIIRYYNIN